jgi:ABC-type antimicrobial peptide transport system permease subunit
MSIKRRVRDFPDNMRLAAISSWRGRERGLAVFAGVFLASLVITTVLSYGVGLSQIFFQESLEQEPFDAKIEFSSAPAYNTTGWSNDTSVMTGVCDELVEWKEIMDCTVVFGRQGIHGGGFFNRDFVVAQPLVMESITAPNPLWANISFTYPELADSGPPISNMRGIRLLGPEAFDGEISERLGVQIISGMGEWPTPEVMEEKRGVILPSNVASEAKAEVGDNLAELTFKYTVDKKVAVEGGFDDDECAGDVNFAENGYIYCKVPITLQNLTILGIYEPWDLGNPTLSPNPIFTIYSVMDVEDQVKLIDADHIYLGITLDRTQMPTSSTAEAEEWLQDLGVRIGDSQFAGGEVELYYFDIVGGTIIFLNIFLGLIQTFDYIIMIPIVVLSLSVLIYGLILSLEQRRREISIHRVIGADSKGLQGMVLLELSVMASVAWLVGYLLALAAVPLVLSSVGFMAFKPGDISVNPALGVVATMATAFATVGLALLFGRSRARDFIELEIEEGVRKVIEVNKPKRWLHWSLFLVGLLGMIDTWLEMNGSEDGIISNFFIEGVINIFGPFMLWIGGALLLARIGAAGPKIMQLIFGRTALLKDVKRGLQGSGSTESVNRLAIIMLLTLSIVTLAAVQGYTGTLVDERTASATVGSDLQITFEEPVNSSTALSIVEQVYGSEATLLATNIPSLTLRSLDNGDTYQAWVLLENGGDVLDWPEQAIPGSSVDTGLESYQDLTFSAGEDAAYALKLWGSGRRGGSSDSGDELLAADDDRSEKLTLIWDEIEFETSTDGDGESPTLTEQLAGYKSLTKIDMSGLNLSGQNLSNRDLGLTDFTSTNLTGANLSGSNLSESLLVGTSLRGANLSGANLGNAIIVVDGESFGDTDLSNASLTGAFGFFDFSKAVRIDGATCPDGDSSSISSCASTSIPPPLALPLLSADVSIKITNTEHSIDLRYIGTHEFIPGVSSVTMGNSLIIGENAWKQLIGEDNYVNYTTNIWILKIDSIEGDELQALRANVEADWRVSSAMDWSTEHEKVERDSGLIFGTPGLLSLQFVVASLAAVASSFVFLSLVLNQRKKELAILQAIGASPSQIIRLVLFEILSIVMVSMALGVLLGMGLALAFNGFFGVFGFIFQIFGSSTATPIDRDLVWPWFELGLVSLSVFIAVVMALLFTTRKALRSDLASVLKGE